MERIILTTGGTGGHVFPALSVAEEVLRRNPRAMILFMGGRYGQEADMAAKAGLDFVGLPVRGVLGRGGRGFLAAFGMLRGLIRACGIIRKVKPELVIGFGGYAGFAGVLAARIAGKPTAIHEQNSYPGMTNRLLGKVVDRVFLSMPDAAGVFDPRKTVLVGNPVRAAIAELYEKRRREFADRDNGGHAEQPDGDGTKSYYGGVDGPSPFDADRRAEAAAPVQAAAEQGGEQAPDSAATATLPPSTRVKGVATPLAGRGAEHRACVPDPTPVTLASSSLPSQRWAGGRNPRLLVMGGSLGARAINQTMMRVIGNLLEAGVEIWHQTGPADYDQVRAVYREAGAEHVRVEAFIADMQRAYAWADLALCRAGGSSMAEITAAGLPAVLVPLPWAAQDHQRHNARFLESEGGAVVLEQSSFYTERSGKASEEARNAGQRAGQPTRQAAGHEEGGPRLFVRTVLSLLQDRPTLEAMALKSLAAARPYAARDLVNELEALIAG